MTATPAQRVDYAYGYDKASNMERRTHNGSDTQFHHSESNELRCAYAGERQSDCPQSARTYAYDDAGNLTSSSSGLQIGIGAKNHSYAGCDPVNLHDPSGLYGGQTLYSSVPKPVKNCLVCGVAGAGGYVGGTLFGGEDPIVQAVSGRFWLLCCGRYQLIERGQRRYHIEPRLDRSVGSRPGTLGNRSRDCGPSACAPTRGGLAPRSGSGGFRQCWSRGSRKEGR